VAFRVSPRSDGQFDYQVIHTFCAHTDCADGAYPSGGLIIDSAGNLYGATIDGGSVPACGGYGCGVVFELSPDLSGGYTYKVLHVFAGGSQGAFPIDTLTLDSAGRLFGVTVGGGNGSGLIFMLSPNPQGTRWKETVLYTFTGGHDGSTPRGGMVFDRAGNLYGVTERGGIKNRDVCDLLTCGLIFELQPRPDGSWTEKIVHYFDGYPDGAGPIGGPIIDGADNLYVITSEEGHDTWEFSPDGSGGWTQTLIGDSGGGSYARLLMDGAGNLYGTTASCVSCGGTAFEFSPDGNGGWSETILYAFCSLNLCLDGALSYAPLIQDSVGNLYGTADVGGRAGYGVVFELQTTSGQNQ
jgi:hypothetical protein